MVAAPAVSLYQLSLPGLQSSAFMVDGGAKLVSVGSLLSTGLI